MLIKLLTKLCFSAGATLGAIIGINPEWINENEEVGGPKKEAILEANQIKTLEDIDIYGKQNGCSFVFVNSWSTKTANSAEKFIAEAGKQKSHEGKEKAHWTDLMTNIVRDTAGECKNDSVLVFTNPDPNGAALSKIKKI